MSKTRPLSNLINTSLETFDQEVLVASEQKPVLVDFWADWCSPCIVLAPVLEAVALEYHDEIIIAKLEVDDGENMKLAGRYKVRGFPTVILFRNGIEVSRFSGAKPKQQIEAFLDSSI